MPHVASRAPVTFDNPALTNVLSCTMYTSTKERALGALPTLTSGCDRGHYVLVVGTNRAQAQRAAAAAHLHCQASNRAPIEPSNEQWQQRVDSSNHVTVVRPLPHRREAPEDEGAAHRRHGIDVRGNPRAQAEQQRAIVGAELGECPHKGDELARSRDVLQPAHGLCPACNWLNSTHWTVHRSSGTVCKR